MPSSVTYFDTNMLAAVPSNAITLTLATKQLDGSFLIQPNGSVKLVVDQITLKRTAALYLKQVIKYTGSVAASSNYEPKSFATLDLKYTGDVTADNRQIFFNRDKVVDAATLVYINESETKTENREIESITILIVNGTPTNLTVNSIELYRSQELHPLEFIEYFKQKSIVSDVIAATVSFSEAQFVQYLRTNLLSMEAVQSLAGGRVNSIEIHDWSISARTAKLSSTVKKPCIIPVYSVNGVSKTYEVFHGVDVGHPMRGKVFSINNPKDQFPDMSPIEVDAQRLWVWDSETDDEKFALKFLAVSDGKGGTTETPHMFFGRGSDPDPTSWRGKMVAFKDYVSGQWKYVTNDGLDRGLIFADDKLDMVGGDFLFRKIRSAVDLASGVEVRHDHPPDEELFDGRIWIVV